MRPPDGPPSGKTPSPLKTLPFDRNSSVHDGLLRSIKAPYRPVLVVLVGNETGQRIVLDGTICVGRNPESQLVLTDAGVSWNHARLEDRGDTWALVDLQSTNGTSVNDERISERVLQRNDKIAFARTVVRFEVQDAYDQAYDVIVERLLNVDDLSGLLVRRKFDAELELMLATARAKGEPVGLLVMDLDGVKAINDTHGHLFGAYTIGEAGNLIGRLIAGRGIGSRFGGDEYLAALPGAGLSEAVAMGERIREAVGDYHFERDGVVLHPGISIGAASYPAQAQDAATLFQAADEAMYRAKQQGKNRVCT